MFTLNNDNLGFMCSVTEEKKTLEGSNKTPEYYCTGLNNI